MKKFLTLSMTILGLFLSTSSFATIWVMGPGPAMCNGDSIMVSNDSVSASGSWGTSNPSVAVIGASWGPYGVYITSVGPGTAVITWTGSSPATFSSLTVTVNPNPSAIGGPSTVCTGSTISLSSTPAGGTWASSSVAVAPVGVSTGIVSGVSIGTSTITYSLATGCRATKIVTVLAMVTDVVSGPDSVCVGSTISLTSSLSGGTWSTSSPGVGTVSTGGVVTGISVGYAAITHTPSATCSISGTHGVFVIAASAGTIFGPTSVAVGSTTTLSSTVTGGTWSNSCASTATIDTSTGMVTGVAAGTCVMTYTKITSCGTAYAYYTVTVTATTPPNCISGNVRFTAGSYVGNVKVWLIKYNPTTLTLTAVDSQIVSCPDTVVGYSFCGMGTDSFRVKAARNPNTAGTGYIPTYHASSTYWNTATVINHVSGTPDINKHITMAYGTVSIGPGFISGNVTTGANKGTADGDPVPGMLIYCVNDVTGAILATAITNTSGYYTFNNLPVGEPYKIYPEDINYATTPYPAITFTSSSTMKTSVNFIQHTISKTITPVITAVNNVSAANTSISIFPNPASGTLNVQWNMANAGPGMVAITDITGRVVLANTIDMTQNRGKLSLDISGINAGMYIVSVKSNGVNYNTKVNIQ